MDLLYMCQNTTAYQPSICFINLYVSVLPCQNTTVSQSSITVINCSHCQSAVTVMLPCCTIQCDVTVNNGAQGQQIPVTDQRLQERARFL